MFGFIIKTSFLLNFSQNLKLISTQMSINISGQIFPLKPDEIQKYAPQALKLYAQKQQNSLLVLSKQQKILVSKIYRNLNILCKLSKKQLKQLFKESKEYLAYQEVLGDLFFDNKINNYILINKEQSNVKIDPMLLRKNCNPTASAYYKPAKCVSVDYRLQFTISNINKKKVMKPIILIVYKLEDLSQVKVYYSIEQFSNLRYEVGESMKKVYGIEMRTMF